MKRPSKKPTMKDALNKINILSKHLLDTRRLQDELFFFFDCYLEMHGEVEKLKSYIKKKTEEVNNDKRRQQLGDIEVVKK